MATRKIKIELVAYIISLLYKAILVSHKGAIWILKKNAEGIAYSKLAKVKILREAYI